MRCETDLSQDADRALEREAWATGSEIDAVAAAFGVSRLSAHWRLYGYGLVEARPG